MFGRRAQRAHQPASGLARRSQHQDRIRLCRHGKQSTGGGAGRPWLVVRGPCPIVRRCRGVHGLVRRPAAGVRAVGAGFSRTELSPPWALRFGDAESLTLLAPLSGEGWISFGDGGKARLARAGDTAIARGPGPFAISDRPEPGRAASADQAVLLTATYRVRGCRVRRWPAGSPSWWASRR
ncbi:cupin domain-containing protein [Saccharopolyspora elongata]|uniref:cupin domain-containing protein n=1 Tax=Saccharopolyspora elongata TaxID=2530387 RepID=UPI001F3CD9FD|nr:cupin domain-containing protein [Saccharopolyspora elongata]